jgi:hypothetical protein
MSVQEHADTAYDAGLSPQLDGGTQLVTGIVGLNWWPSAGEAVAYLAMAPRESDPEADEQRRADRELLEVLDPELAARMQADRDAENGARAARRAKSRLRRYVVANGLTRMFTLTFRPSMQWEVVSDWWSGGGSPDSAEAVHESDSTGACKLCGRPHGPLGVGLAMRRAATWIRRLRRYLGLSEAFPYVLVPEFHKDGHLHLHVLVRLFIDAELLELSWGYGFVDAGSAKKFTGSGAREAARKAARYANKYVSKGFAEGVPGRHRYEVGQGFQPSLVKRSGYRTLEAAVSFVEDHGQEVSFAVHSDGLEDYDGPPFLWVALEATP